MLLPTCIRFCIGEVLGGCGPSHKTFTRSGSHRFCASMLGAILMFEPEVPALKRAAAHHSMRIKAYNPEAPIPNPKLTL